MIIGIPKEIKNHEYRVGMTPAGVEQLVSAGHKVYVQTKAGEGPGFSDKDYTSVGAKTLGTPKEVFDIAEMIIKIKEPVDPEFTMMKKGQIWYTYPLHGAGGSPLAAHLKCRGKACLAPTC